MNTGDLGDNAYRLLKVVSQAPPSSRFIDIGVRAGVSSDILLEGATAMNNRVFGIDVDVCPPHLTDHPNYWFMRGDSVTELSEWKEGPVWLTFHDTLHIAEQVMAELYYAWPLIRVGGFAVFHDTGWPIWKHDCYLGVTWDRVEIGILKFFEPISKCVAIDHFAESYGMTFVRKTDECDPRDKIDWNPIFDARNRLLSLLEGINCNKKIIHPCKSAQA